MFSEGQLLLSQTESVCAECRWRYLLPLSLNPCAYLPVSAPLLLHNYLISFLLRQSLELERCLCLGAVPFTPDSPFSLNAPFVPLIITIQRECHTLLNESATVGETCAAARISLLPKSQLQLHAFNSVPVTNL